MHNVLVEQIQRAFLVIQKHLGENLGLSCLFNSITIQFLTDYISVHDCYITDAFCDNSALSIRLLFFNIRSLFQHLIVFKTC